MPQLANADLVIWLVIIVMSIVGQIIKAASRKAKAAITEEDAPTDASERTSSPARARTVRNQGEDPNSEIRQFLKGIGLPMPPPAAKPKASRPPPRKAPSPPPPKAARNAGGARGLATLQDMTPATILKPLDMEQTVTPAHSSSSTRNSRDLKEFLAQRRTLQQAVLLREILGPPITQRKHHS